MTGAHDEAVRRQFAVAFAVAVLVSQAFKRGVNYGVLAGLAIYSDMGAVLLLETLHLLVFAVCTLVAFRRVRQDVAVAGTAAIAYLGITVLAGLLLQLGGVVGGTFSLSKLAGWASHFPWAAFLLAGLVLALRWVRRAWLVLGLAAFVGELSHFFTLWSALGNMTRPQVSVLLSVAPGNVSVAMVFAYVFWVALQTVRADKGRMSKWFFLTSCAALFVIRATLLPLVYYLTFAPARAGLVEILGGVLLLSDLCGNVVGLVQIYRMWAAVQDGHARTSPGMAVGLLFVPLFNLYWGFQCLRGFAKDYNAYVRRYSLDAPQLSTGLFTAVVILNLLSPLPLVDLVVLIPGALVNSLVVARICEAVNALPARTPLL